MFLLLLFARNSYIISIGKMGLVYSLTNYFYPTATPKLSQHAIRTKAQRLILCIKQAQFRLQKSTIKQEQQLITIITKTSYISRSRQAEKLMMQLVITNSEKLLLYDQVMQCLSRIMAEAGTLEEKPGSISNQCIKAINSLIFVYDRMQLKQFVSLSEFIPEPHPTIGIQQTSALIQKYLKNKQVSHFELNLYGCQLCARNNLSVDIFNAVGHGFHQNPQQPQQQSASARMFAVTLEDVAVEQQLHQ